MSADQRTAVFHRLENMLLCSAEKLRGDETPTTKPNQRPFPEHSLLDWRKTARMHFECSLLTFLVSRMSRQIDCGPRLASTAHAWAASRVRGITETLMEFRLAFQ